MALIVLLLFLTSITNLHHFQANGESPPACFEKWLEGYRLIHARPEKTLQRVTLNVCKEECYNSIECAAFAYGSEREANGTCELSKRTTDIRAAANEVLTLSDVHKSVSYDVYIKKSGEECLKTSPLYEDPQSRLANTVPIDCLVSHKTGFYLAPEMARATVTVKNIDECRTECLRSQQVLGFQCRLLAYRFASKTGGSCQLSDKDHLQFLETGYLPKEETYQTAVVFFFDDRVPICRQNVFSTTNNRVGRDYFNRGNYNYPDKYSGGNNYNDRYYGGNNYNDRYYGGNNYNDRYNGGSNYNDRYSRGNNYNDRYSRGNYYDDRYSRGNNYDDRYSRGNNYYDRYSGRNNYYDPYYDRNQGRNGDYRYSGNGGQYNRYGYFNDQRSFQGNNNYDYDRNFRTTGYNNPDYGRYGREGDDRFSGPNADYSTGAGQTSVNGERCLRQCRQNRDVGFFYCEIDDQGLWEFCCRPDHFCGFSPGISTSWCYVGTGPSHNMWRSCDHRISDDRRQHNRAYLFEAASHAVSKVYNGTSNTLHGNDTDSHSAALIDPYSIPENNFTDTREFGNIALPAENVENSQLKENVRELVVTEGEKDVNEPLNGAKETAAENSQNLNEEGIPTKPSFTIGHERL